MITAASTRTHEVYCRQGFHLHGSQRILDDTYAWWTKSLGVGRFPGLSPYDGAFRIDMASCGAECTANFGRVTQFILQDPEKALMVAFTNRVVNAHNRKLFEAHLAQLRLPTTCYLAADVLDDPHSGETEVTPELVPASERLSDFSLAVCKGSLVTCLRNLMPSIGLQNGARIRVTKHSKYRIEGIVVQHPIHAGRKVSIPRIKMDGKLVHGVGFKRLQFPLTLGYCMTSNRVQGQTVAALVLDVTEDSFAHGQLYTAMTRVRRPEHLLIFDETAQFRTTAVIYRELLSEVDSDFNKNEHDDVFELGL